MTWVTEIGGRSLNRATCKSWWCERSFPKCFIPWITQWPWTYHLIFQAGSGHALLRSWYFWCLCVKVVNWWKAIIVFVATAWAQAC